MKKDYILFIDSGIGGLSTLAYCINAINYDYIYYADNKNCPYGSHSKEEIKSFLINIISNILKKFSIKVIVLACNTATAAAIDDLRNIYPDLIIIGTEPALTLAAKLGNNNIISLTTPLTSQLERYNNLILLSKKNIFTLSIKNLVYDIEKFYFFPNFQNRFFLLKNIATICNYSKNFDCIVLGCTHYVFLKPFILQFLKINLIDGNTGISQNLKNKLSQITDRFCKKSSIKIILSKQNNHLKKKYKKILSQTLANLNNLC